MTFINKEKFLNGVGKAVDVANNAADKVSEFAKEKEIDKKIMAAADKVENFAKEKEIDKKVTSAVDKVENFVKEKEIDKKASNIAHSVGTGIKKAGSKIEETFEKK